MVKNMNWLEESNVDIRQYNGESLCEMLADKIWDYHREEWLKCPEFIQNACFLIDFDTELNMEGILTILINTDGEYLPHIIKAFRAIGDSQDAEILAEISRCKPPEPVEKIVELEQQLYLNRDFDIWELLYQYLDKEIEKLK